MSSKRQPDLLPPLELVFNIRLQSANSIAREACSSLSMVLRKPGKKLATLDLSCNELQVFTNVLNTLFE